MADLVTGGVEPTDPAGVAAALDEANRTASRAAERPLARTVVTYGWLPLVILAATQVLEAGERQSLAQAVDDLQKDFGLSDLAISVIPFAMSIVGGFGAIPFGHFADHARRTLLLAGGMALWTLSMFMTGFATGFAFLFAARMLVGAVEANGPAIVSLIADYYPARQRAKYMGLYSSGGLLGALLGLVGGGIAVELGGWQWGFWMWVPFGVVVTAWVASAPEPPRGQRDEEFDDSAVALDPTLARLDLPPPDRVGTLDYAHAGPRDVMRELLHIPTMWLALVALFVSQLLLVALGFWAVEYFKRVHDLGAASAGGLTALLGAGSVIGILAGGFVADRWVRRGVVNARIYVVAFGSIAGGLLLMPAFASSNLLVTAPLFFLGGLFLTFPLAPGEAVVSDVIVGELRGRAAAVRSFLRSFAAIGVLIVGGLSELITLRWALVAVCPAYVVGGLLVLLATRTYPKDLAFVAAEARRRGEPV
jgi:MFS family permease